MNAGRPTHRLLLLATLLAFGTMFLTAAAASAQARTGKGRHHRGAAPAAVTVKLRGHARSHARSKASAAARTKVVHRPTNHTTVRTTTATTTTAAPTTTTTTAHAPVITTPAAVTTTASGTTSVLTTTSATTTSPSAPVTGTTTASSPSPTASAPPATGSAQPNSIYWGAVLGTQFNGNTAPWDMNVVSDFEQRDSAGKGLSIIPMYQPFSDCSTTPCTPYPFPWTPLNNIRAAGAIPMVSWSSDSLQDPNANGATDANFTLAKVASGAFDAYITAWAQKAKQWGHPFFLRFDWEMNGNWFVWGQNTNGNSAADFVAAWRHVHDIFTRVGATNASWVWCPNVGYDTNPSLASLYPGDQYVDWTGLDGYNWAGNQGNPWETFDQVMSRSYGEITQQIAPAKPMMIGEFNTAGSGAARAAWMTQTLSEIPTNYPDIHAIVLYDQDPLFTLETDPAAVSAFSAGINAPAYAANNYANLNTTSVPVP